MLGEVLSSRSGDMYKQMVLDREVATAVGASASTSMYDGAFRVSATVKEVGRGPWPPPMRSRGSYGPSWNGPRPSPWTPSSSSG